MDVWVVSQMSHLNEGLKCSYSVTDLYEQKCDEVSFHGDCSITEVSSVSFECDQDHDSVFSLIPLQYGSPSGGLWSFINVVYWV